MKGRKIVQGKIPSYYRYICNISEKGSSKDGETKKTIDLYQCDETGTYYLYYEERVYSFQFAVGSIPRNRFYLEISEEERNASYKELIQLVDSI